MVDLAVDLDGLSLCSPIMPASGCFAIEYAEALDFNQLGALVIKSVSPRSRPGNPTPRVAETAAGMLNSIGIPSKGLDYFLDHVLPPYLQFGTPVVVSVSADTVGEFAQAAARLSVAGVAAIEANISCPNLEADGLAFAMDPEATCAAMRAVKSETMLPVWAKLTPNVSHVAEIACAAESGGANALVMGNTVLGMAIDVHTRKPRLGNVMGGLSGPAIKPIAVRMVYQCHRSVSIPIIGCGGIACAEDVVEFMLAGASAVQVGAASFQDPGIMQKITDDLVRFCDETGVQSVSGLTGALALDADLTDSWLRMAQQSG
ncbi:MAG TPA: dihydroorotate dehydrogenase [Castellaniella sp.]|jgi:dihydroorotate dehydrogenase (NAD+) catalytic subunit|nr:dihydroorotate dehydrogenase [Castellaniella sp.]